MSEFINNIINAPTYQLIFGGGGLIVILSIIATVYSNNKKSKKKRHKNTTINNITNNHITNINNSNNKLNNSNNSNKVQTTTTTPKNILVKTPTIQRYANNIKVEKISLYSTTKGKKSVSTNTFYKSQNHNFGVEIHMRNMSNITQNIHVGGCVYDSNGTTKITWKNVTVSIPPHGLKKWDFYVKENSFSTMGIGKYKIQFWINNTRIQKEFFEIKK